MFREKDRIRAENEMKTYAITIAGGFGCGGREIASRLADELGIHSYENRILTLAAQYSGRDEQAFLTSLAGLVLVLFWILPYIYDLFETMKNLFAL